MTDTFTPRERSEIMRRVRGRDTSPELILRRALWAAGVRGYRLHDRRLPGKPDLVFRRLKLVIFVDGCFWHGCPRCYRRPNSNQAYWDAKVGKNKARDVRNRRKLRREGWSVIRVWEHQLKPARLDSTVARILKRHQFMA